MIEWGFVPWHLVASEIAPNIERFHREMSEGDGSETPDPDWDTYQAASHNGNVWVVTARENGVLIGYAAFVIANNLRYKRIIEATCNSIFVESSHRGLIGKKLLEKADEFLSNAGVHETQYINKGPRFDRLLARHGYGPEFTIWRKKYGQ